MASGTPQRRTTLLEYRRTHRVASTHTGIQGCTRTRLDVSVDAHEVCPRGGATRGNRGSAEKKTREHCTLITLLSARR